MGIFYYHRRGIAVLSPGCKKNVEFIVILPNADRGGIRNVFRVAQ